MKRSQDVMPLYYYDNYPQSNTALSIKKSFYLIVGITALYIHSNMQICTNSLSIKGLQLGFPTLQ